MDPIADDQSAMSHKEASVAARDRTRAEDQSDPPSPDGGRETRTAPGIDQPSDECGEGVPPSESAIVDEPRRAVGDTGRWWTVVVLTSLLSMPFGWLLSYAAQLPFYLGLFFFVLFGLVIGAAACRMAASRGPFSRGAVLVGTTIIIASCWLTSIVTECLDFPDSMAVKAVAAASTLGDRDLAAYKQSVAETARGVIQSKHSGPILGYVRWVVTDGEMKANTIAGVRKALRPVHRRQGWVIRVLVSIALLSFGIATQTWPLRSAGDGRRAEPATPE